MCSDTTSFDDSETISLLIITVNFVFEKTKTLLDAASFGDSNYLFTFLFYTKSLFTKRSVERFVMLSRSFTFDRQVSRIFRTLVEILLEGVYLLRQYVFESL